MAIEIIIKRLNGALGAKDETAARKLHDELNALAKTKEERLLVHDIGNEVQKLIFEKYLDV